MVLEEMTTTNKKSNLLEGVEKGQHGELFTKLYNLMNNPKRWGLYEPCYPLQREIFELIIDDREEKAEGIRKISSNGSSVIDAGLIIRYLNNEISLDEAIKIHSPFLITGKEEKGDSKQE